MRRIVWNGQQVALTSMTTSFNQRSDISTLNGWFLKLVDKFTYLGRSVSFTEHDSNTWLAKVWIAIDRLSVIWKSNLADDIKRSFFLSSGRVTTIWMHQMDADWLYGEKARWQLHKNTTSYIEQILGAISHKAAAVRPPATHLENHSN